MTPECALGKDEHAVPADFEHSPTPLQELDGCVRICLANLGRQTGGPGFVVSNDAVTDGDMHVGGGRGGFQI